MANHGGFTRAFCRIGVGLHHARSGNYRGAVLLLTDGIDKSSQFTPEYRGLDTARPVREAQACLDQVELLGADGLNGSTGRSLR
ncbi:MAG: hypothetical protein R2845_05415 [Thermomicrobiales bacterium]